MLYLYGTTTQAMCEFTSLSSLVVNTHMENSLTLGQLGDKYVCTYVCTCM